LALACSAVMYHRQSLSLGGGSTSPLSSVRCSVDPVSGQGGVPPCPGTTRLSLGCCGSCGACPLRVPLRGPSGLHRVLFCKVAASRCAKAPLGVVHRFAPSRVYKTHPMQSTSAGVSRTAVGAPRSHSRPTRRRLAPLWLSWHLGISQALRAGFPVSGLRPVMLCVPRPPLGLAAARHWPCAGLPVHPQGVPSAQRLAARSGVRFSIRPTQGAAPTSVGGTGRTGL